ncbi:MAG: ClbS/DfsB family four-helix bundle protein, partial [Lachnospiraceae bacterium]|nr:ClbS/DfsB family four-helix bundle protein [Lachnospiraceae bacterium]
QNSDTKPFIPAPYNWRTYGDMNVEFWEKHQGTPLEDAKKMLQESHEKVMALAERFSQEELFSRGAFPWCGDNALASYLISNTSSHYEWALKKLKAHRKNCK